MCVALAVPIAVAEARQQPGVVAERARAALELPASVDSVRKHGAVPESDIRRVLDEVRRRRVSAAEARDVMKETDASIREHGPVDNFGAFVQGRLAAGLRGRALAQSIKAEHARRGIGKGKVLEVTQAGAAKRPAAANAEKGKGRAANSAAKAPTKTAPGAKAKTAPAAKTKTAVTNTNTATKSPSAKTQSTTKNQTKAKTPTKTKARP